MRRHSRAFFLFAALFLAASAVWYGWCAATMFGKPSEHMRLVFRFATQDDGEAVDRACDVFRARLKKLDAEDVSVERRGASEVLLEFLPPKTGPFSANDEVLRVLSARGRLSFYIGATESTFTGFGKDLGESQKRVVDWMTKPENAQVSIDIYNALAEAEGGPPAGICWYPQRPEASMGEVPRDKRLLRPLLIGKPEWTFGTKNLETVGKSMDRTGNPAMSFRLRAESIEPFGEFTGAHVNEPLVVALDEEVVSYAHIGERLPGEAQIYGRFADREVDEMVDRLRSGELPSKPVLVSSEHVAARRSSAQRGLVIAAVLSAVAAIGMLVVRSRIPRRLPA